MLLSGCGVNRNVIVTWLGWLLMNLAAALQSSLGERVEYSFPNLAFQQGDYNSVLFGGLITLMFI